MPPKARSILYGPCSSKYAIELILIVCFYYQNIAMNLAQLLVHNDAALAKFQVKHNIPADVLKKRSSPNEYANWVEGEDDRIPVRTWLIHQVGLRFLVSQLLKAMMAMCHLTFMQVLINFIQIVLAVDVQMRREEKEFTEYLLHVYWILRPRRNSETHMYEGNHYLCLKNLISLKRGW